MAVKPDVVTVRGSAGCEPRGAGGLGGCLIKHRGAGTRGPWPADRVNDGIRLTRVSSAVSPWGHQGRGGPRERGPGGPGGPGGQCRWGSCW